jgi:hypothetical protein
MAVVPIHCVMDFHSLLWLPSRSQQGVKIHYTIAGDHQTNKLKFVVTWGGFEPTEVEVMSSTL